MNVKIMVLILLIGYGFSKEADVQDGINFARNANKKAEDIKNGGANAVEIEKTDRPHQVGYNTHEELLKQQQNQKQTDETYKILTDGSKNIGELENVEFKNPLKEDRKLPVRSVIKSTSYTCFESAEPYQIEFKKYLQIKLKLIPEILITEAYCDNHGWQRVNAPFLRGCFLNGYTKERVKNDPQIKRRESVLRKRSVVVIDERWVGGDGMDNVPVPNAFLYDLEVKDFDGGEETRLIEAVSDKDEQGIIHHDKEPIKRPSWEKYSTILIKPKVCHDCDLYKHQKNCRQESAQCVEKISLKDGTVVCLKWQKKYICDEVDDKEEDLDLEGMNVIPEEKSESNENMYAALSKLEMLKQIEQNQEVDGKNISIFKGTIKRCTTNFGGGFKDCCNRNGGWGTSIGLGTKCSAEENVLKKMRDENRCVHLRTTEKKSFARITISTEEVYSCFPTALAKSIQEGARKQLGIRLGISDESDSRGLTPQELEKIDFSKIDLSESFKGIHESTEKMAKEIEQDLKKKQSLLKQPGSSKKIEDDTKRFNVTETLTQVNTRTENKKEEVYIIRDQRREKRKKEEGQ